MIPALAIVLILIVVAGVVRAALPAKDWHPVNERGVQRDDVIRVRYKLTLGEDGSIQRRVPLEVAGVVYDVTPLGITLDDLRFISGDDLQGALIDVWRR